jgi:2-methylcitrate dehydratase PrpD
MDMRVSMRDGRILLRQIDIAPGFPGNPLTRDDHRKRFEDCLAFAKKQISWENAEKIVSMIEQLEDVKNVRELVQLLSD